MASKSINIHQKPGSEDQTLIPIGQRIITQQMKELTEKSAGKSFEMQINRDSYTEGKKSSSKEQKSVLRKKNSKEGNSARVNEINNTLNEDDNSRKANIGNTSTAQASLLTKRSLENAMGESNNFIEFGNASKVEEMQNLEDSFRVFKKIRSANKNKKDRKEGNESVQEREITTNTREKDTPVLTKKLSDRFRNTGAPKEPTKMDMDKRLAPWLTDATRRIDNTLIRFHNEILDFVELIGPSKKVQNMRKQAFDRLAAIVQECFPEAECVPFGSYVTGLYLPQSDIDVVVVEPNCSNHTLLNKIAKVFMKNSNYEAINVIRSAKVPLVKVIESSTGINFDISFNIVDGVNQVQQIQKALDYYPEMRHIILVIKCFLKQRDLNETFQGGIGSFLLFCLTLAFLREIKNEYSEYNNPEEFDKILLSEFVLRFLDFFANFDLQRKQILIADGGAIVNKYIRDYGLSVISPQDPTHDIGRAAFRIKEVFGIFKNRHHFLVNYNFARGESILKFLINGDHI